MRTSADGLTAGTVLHSHFIQGIQTDSEILLHLQLCESVFKKCSVWDFNSQFNKQTDAVLAVVEGGDVVLCSSYSFQVFTAVNRLIL